jgi:hypothetical protein
VETKPLASRAEGCYTGCMAKKRNPSKKTPAVRTRPQVPEAEKLLAEVRGLMDSARSDVAQAVNSAHVIRHRLKLGVRP